jgi:hypothetical protein
MNFSTYLNFNHSPGIYIIKKHDGGELILFLCTETNSGKVISMTHHKYIQQDAILSVYSELIIPKIF